MKSHKFTAAAIIAAALCTAAFAQTATPAAAPAAAPNEIVYVPQLPSAADLTKAATAQGVTVAQIDQTSSQVIVTYKYSNGAVNTVSYQPLSAIDSGTAVPQPATAAPAVAAGTTVVYTTTTPAYYAYPYYGYGYYPWGWYPPVSIGLGFGFHGGGFRGGFHGGWR
jgi:hypothetical protein